MGLVDFFKNVNLGYLVAGYVTAMILGWAFLFAAFVVKSLSVVALLLLFLGGFLYITALVSALVKIGYKPWNDTKKLLWRGGAYSRFLHFRTIPLSSDNILCTVRARDGASPRQIELR